MADSKKKTPVAAQAKKPAGTKVDAVKAAAAGVAKPDLDAVRAQIDVPVQEQLIVEFYSKK